MHPNTAGMGAIFTAAPEGGRMEERIPSSEEMDKVRMVFNVLSIFNSKDSHPYIQLILQWHCIYAGAINAHIFDMKITIIKLIP